MPPLQQDDRSLRQSDRVGQSQGISQDLVKQVTDKVYAMLMRDLRIERERYPPSAKGLSGRGGMW